MQEDTMATTHELERPKQARSSDREILVVDDEGLIRGLLLRFLPTIGFAVTVAGNGKEGLDLFLKKSFALVLTDLRMPEMDGCTLGRHIKDTSPQVRRLL
jgi:CheY-like chemotaxis protein